jgi:hypothetical protein
MKNKSLLITSLLLIVSIGNYFRIIEDGTVRTVEFLSIFAVGVLSGMLILQVVQLLKSK